MDQSRTLVAVVFAGIAFIGCTGQPSPGARATASGPATVQNDATTRECEDRVIIEHAFSASDDTDLVGFADNVFVGLVKERVGFTRRSPTRPFGSTRFSVEVTENVKGRIGGSVTVSQDGAYDPDRDCTMLMEDDPLLKPRQEVMFFTRRDEQNGWHQIVAPGYGDVRIESKRQREDLVRRFKAAKEHQTDPAR